MEYSSQIKREVGSDPRRPGPANARLRRSGVPVWAIVGYFLDVAKVDGPAVARAYDVSPEAVRAAVEFYELHRIYGGENVNTCGLRVTLLEPCLLIRRVVRPGGRWRSGLRRGRGRRGGARSPHATGLGRLQRA